MFFHLLLILKLPVCHTLVICVEVQTGNILVAAAAPRPHKPVCGC